MVLLLHSFWVLRGPRIVENNKFTSTRPHFPPTRSNRNFPFRSTNPSANAIFPANSRPTAGRVLPWAQHFSLGHGLSCFLHTRPDPHLRRSLSFTVSFATTASSSEGIQNADDRSAPGRGELTSRLGMDWVWSSGGGLTVPALHATAPAVHVVLMSCIECRVGGGNQWAEPTRAHSWLFRSSSSSLSFFTNFSPANRTRPAINIILLFTAKYARGVRGGPATTSGRPRRKRRRPAEKFQRYMWFFY